MEQAGAGFHKPEQQQRLVLPVEAGQDDYIKEICSPEGFFFLSCQILVRVVSLPASFQSKGEVIFDFENNTKLKILFDNLQ